jgi:hypothetical protein
VIRAAAPLSLHRHTDIPHLPSPLQSPTTASHPPSTSNTLQPCQVPFYKLFATLRFTYKTANMREIVRTTSAARFCFYASPECPAMQAGDNNSLTAQLTASIGSSANRPMCKTILLDICLTLMLTTPRVTKSVLPSGSFTVCPHHQQHPTDKISTGRTSLVNTASMALECMFDRIELHVLVADSIKATMAPRTSSSSV